MKDIADDLALIVRNAIDYINKLERQINELKQKPVQEPVAWKDRTYESLHHQDFGNSIPLYTTPPQRKPLTDEEIRQIALDTPIGGTNFARAIERAHGIGEKE